MYDGVFEGKLAAEQIKKVLILGESHYATDPEWWVKTGRTTTCVINDYLEQYSKPDGREKCYRFFDKIVSSFGYDCETQREDFWNKVYFGNYVDVLCGKRNGKANKAIKKQKKEENDVYNQELFKFINDKDIDVVFCFSKLVWKNLPVEIPYTQKTENNYIKSCIYEAEKESGNIPALEKSLKVYGMYHPSSWGYSPKKYQAILHDAIEETRK